MLVLWRASVVLALLLGAAQAVTNQYAMNPDGVSYLDIADAFSAHDWGHAINAYWSPLYPIVLAVFLAVGRSLSLPEFPVVHAANFSVYVLALCTFTWFLSVFVGCMKAKEMQTGIATLLYVPEKVIVPLAYTLFIMTSLNVASLTLVTPDLLVAATIYAASALLLRSASEGCSKLLYVELGLVLGIGYLAKAFVLPLASIFIFVVALTGKTLMDRLRASLLTGGALLVVCAPLIVVLSSSHGGLTFGDSGRLNYAWFVDGVTPYVEWQGEPGGAYGTPVHPPRRLETRPDLYEFGSPILATYAPWFDPTYWYDGIRPTFNLRGQVQTIAAAVAVYADVLSGTLGIMLAPILAIVVVTQLLRPVLRRKQTVRALLLIIPALASLAMYAVVHAEPRFIPASVVLLVMGYLALVVVRRSAATLTLMSVACAAALSAALVSVWRYDAELVPSAIAELSQGSSRESGYADARLASSLRGLGIEPGATVATIGYGLSAYWARIARVRVVADAPGGPSEDAVLNDPAARNRAIDALAPLGVRAVVAHKSASILADPEWISIPETDYAVYPLTGSSGVAIRPRAHGTDTVRLIAKGRAL